MQLHAALQQATLVLNVSSESAARDAEVLLCHVLGKPLAYLRTHPESELDEESHSAYWRLIEKRQAGEPIAYLLGAREFWSLPFFVNKDTLIPRPETELLVEETLTHVGDAPDLCVVDLGTGSGVIALALASERPQWQITATDASMAALRMAQKNARHLNLDNVQFEFGSWFSPLKNKKFHAIVSNPPYIAARDPHLQSGDVRFEPSTALVAGEDGLDDIRIIVQQSPEHLHTKGWLLIEHGYDQAEVVRELMRKEGFAHVKSLHDLSGHERVTVGCWSMAPRSAS